MVARVAVVVLFGGPAGAGKSTLARLWCGTRPRAAHLELDAVRELIVHGLADPQEAGREQAEQYVTAVAATCALARAFAGRGYDVAVDDVLEPEPYEREWRPRLEGLDVRLVIVLPELAATLDRGAGRGKRVREEHVRAQHERTAAWGEGARVDTTGLTPQESLELVLERLGATS
jgi:chloramphenicol 3-O-phosphotransferase